LANHAPKAIAKAKKNQFRFTMGVPPLKNRNGVPKYAVLTARVTE
jgi:hypothetical protein